LYTVPLRDIETTKVTEIETKQMIGKRTNFLFEIVFIENNQNYSGTSGDSVLHENDQNNKRSVKIDLDKKYIPLLQEQINAFREKQINPSIRRAIALAKNSKLCIQCAENKYALEYKSDHNLCLECFRRNYGKVILEAPNAEYYGGHKAYLGGGAFGKYHLYSRQKRKRQSTAISFDM